MDCAYPAISLADTFVLLLQYPRCQLSSYRAAQPNCHCLQLVSSQRMAIVADLVALCFMRPTRSGSYPPGGQKPGDCNYQLIRTTN